MITLYTTHCPKCVVLEKKLTQKGIQFGVVEDVIEMEMLGIHFAPALRIDDGPIMNFTKAIEWVNSQPNKEI